MSNTKRIKYLESKLPQPEAELEKLHWKKFEKQARYLGGGCYEWCGCHSTDTRELWLMGLLCICEVPFSKN